MIDPGIRTAIADLADVLDTARVEYVIGGSVASMVHGVRRLTDDVDVAIVIDTRGVGALASLPQREFVVAPGAIAEAVRSVSSFNAMHRTTWTRMDVYVRSKDAYFATQLQRAQRVMLDQALDRRAWFASAEDVVLEKLRWYELGGRTSEKQWKDVMGVLRTNAERVDVDYLRKWADALAVRALLDRALTEAGVRRGE